ncbi:hypothetical protein Bca4012_035623 [Brassica carinata]
MNREKLRRPKSSPLTCGNSSPTTPTLASASTRQICRTQSGALTEASTSSIFNTGGPPSRSSIGHTENSSGPPTRFLGNNSQHHNLN